MEGEDSDQCMLNWLVLPWALMNCRDPAQMYLQQNGGWGVGVGGRSGVGWGSYNSVQPRELTSQNASLICKV